MDTELDSKTGYEKEKGKWNMVLLRVSHIVIMLISLRVLIIYVNKVTNLADQ